MAAQKPLVSVIIPVYNGERFLSAALDSVIEQNYRPLELIVVDDGSSDRTAEIVRDYQEVCYLHQKNQGPGAARNTGIVVAQGEFVAFLDADDIWYPNKLKTQVAYLLEHPQIGGVITRMHVSPETGTAWPAGWDREYFQQDPPALLPSSLLVRQVILKQVGMFDQQLGTAEDRDWFARAKFLNVQIAMIDSALLRRRIHDRNISVNTAGNIKNLFTVLRRSAARNRTIRKK